MKKMKMFAAVAIAALTLGLTGCSKSNEDLIIGKWNVTKMAMTLTVSGAGEEYDGTNTEEETYEEGQVVFTFNKDNTVEIKAVEGENSTGKYTVKDDVLTITSSDGEALQVFNILTLDKKELVISNSESMTQDGVTMSMDVEIHMKKA